MRWAARFLRTLAAWSSWIACSNDTTDANAWSAEAEAFVQDFCALTEACCAPARSADADCSARVKAYGLGKSFNASRAKACLDGLRTASKEASFCAKKYDDVACLAVWTSGQTPTGEPCTTNAACASGTEGDGLCVGSGKAATCLAVTRGIEGAPCVGTRANGATNELLAPAARASALCFVADGLHCDGTSKVCVRRGVLGTTCSSSVGACVEEAWCPPDTKQCSLRTPTNGPCTETDGCLTGSRCATNAGGASVCLPFAKKGEACERGDECDPSLALICDASTTTCITDASVAEAICTGSAALGL